jgi:hypothetical protein
MELTPTPFGSLAHTSCRFRMKGRAFRMKGVSVSHPLLEESMVARGLPFEPIGMLAALVLRFG